jgi:hypothetical protein
MSGYRRMYFGLLKQGYKPTEARRMVKEYFGRKS